MINPAATPPVVRSRAQVTPAPATLQAVAQKVAIAPHARLGIKAPYPIAEGAAGRNAD
jgi:hypothetical protein